MKHILLLFLFINTLIQAMELPYRFQHLKVNDKLLQRSIRAIGEDSDGILWFASYMGLSSYNGYDLKNYFNDVGKEAVLGNNEVLHIYLDKQQRFWAGGFGGTINLYDSTRDKFEIFKIDGINSFINDIKQLDNGMLLIASNEGLFTFDYESKSSETIDILYNTRVDEILVQGKELYLTTNQGLLLFNLDSLQYRVIDNNPNVYCLAKYKDEIIYSIGNKVYFVDKKEFLDLGAEVTVIYTDSRSNLWIGANEGLYLYKDSSLYLYDKNTEDKLYDNRIHSIFESSHGILWVGTDAGFNFTMLHSGNFTPILTDEKNPISTWSIAKDKDENLILATRNRGLIRYRGDKVEVLLDKVLNTVIYEDDKIYAGTKFHGLFILDNNGSLIKKLDKIDGLKNNEVRALYKDKDGKLWIGSEQGLYTYEEEIDKLKEVNKPMLGNSRITQIVADKKDRGVINLTAFGHGLVRYNTIDNTWESIDYLKEGFLTRPWSLYDLGRKVYVGDLSFGVFEIDKYSRSVERLDLDIAGKGALALVLDKYDRLWISSNRGLSYYRNGVFKQFTSVDGIQEGEFNPGSVYLDRDGIIYFGGDNGVTRINENFKEEEVEEVKISFTGLRYLESNEEVNLIKTKEVKVPNKSRDFALSFSKLDYGPAEKGNYALRVNGGPWVKLGNRRELLYIDMAKGKYEFEIRYYLEDGSLSESFDKLELKVEAFWFESNVAKVFYLMIASTLVVLIYSYYRSTKKLNLQEELNILNILLLKSDTLDGQVKELLELINKLFITDILVLLVYNEKTKMSYKYSLINGKVEKASDTWDGKQQNIYDGSGIERLYISSHEGLNTMLTIHSRSNRDFKGFQLLKLRKFLEQGTSSFSKKVVYEEEIGKIYIDELTSLYNRRYLNKYTNDLILNGIEYSVLLIDIDHFKMINDTYGHPIGDIILEKISQILSSIEACIATRYGGEEFLLISNEKNHKILVEKAEGIRKAIDKEVFKIGGLELHITVSIGVAIGSRRLKGDELIEKADEALYLAKNSGRNHVKIKL